MDSLPKKPIPGKMYDVNVAKLRPDPDQPRKFFDEQAMTGLTSSIEKYGVLQPVLVRHGEDDSFLLVSGERRYQASLAAGRTTIPVILTKGDPVEISIVENLLREDLTAIEQAEAIDRLRNSHQYQLTDLAGILGKSESTISEILSLNRLPEAIKDDCRCDPTTPRGILAAIAMHHTADKMHALYEKYKAKGLTRGEIRGSNSSSKPVIQSKAAAAVKPVDLGFVQTLTKRLDGIEAETLSPTQIETLLKDLDVLRLTVRKKLRVLKATPLK